MSAKLKFLLFGLALLAALPVLALLLLRIGGLTPIVNLALRSALRPLSTVELRVGSLRSDALNFLEADDVVILAPLKGAKVPLLTIASLRLEFDAYGAWSGRVPKDEALRLARIRGLSVFILRDLAGRWNTSVLFEGRTATPKAQGRPMALPLIPAGRVELEDSQVVFNDESKGFHSSIERLQGSLDTRALPLLAFSLAGRTEGVGRDNLSMAGEADLRDNALDGRLDLAGVELKDYLNYLLPGKGLRFEGGKASLSVRLRTRPGEELLAEGRADLQGGRLRIPGVTEPLSDLNGRVAFDPHALRFKALSARFLGSLWSVEGGINDLRHPNFDLRLKNPIFGLQALSEQVHGLQPLALSGSASVDVSMVGPAKSPRIQGTVNAAWLGLAGVELKDVRAGVDMEGPRLRVHGMRASVWDGALQGELALGLGKEGRLNADMVLDGVHLELASIHGQRPLPLSGTAFLELKMQGLARDPAMDLRLEVEQAYLGVLPLGKVVADAQWAPDAWSTEFGLMNGRIQGKLGVAGGRNGSFKDSAIDFKGIELGPLAKGLATAPPSSLLKPAASKGAQWFEAHLQGQADARVSLEGPLHEATVWIEFQRLNGQLRLKEGFFALRDQKRPLELEGDGIVGFSNGDALFGRKGQPLRLRLAHQGHQWEAQALGRYPLKADGRPGALDLSLESDLRLLDAFGFFSRSGGRLSFDGRVGGTLDAPQARGELRVDGFATEPAAYLAPIQDGRLRAQLREQMIEVPELKFKAGGALQASGRLDLSGGLKALSAELEVRTDAEGVRLQNWEAMGAGNVIFDPLRVSVAGETQPIKLNGRIKLANAAIVYAGQAKKAESGGEAGRRSRGFDLDLRVGLGPNVWYEKLHDKKLDLFDPSQWLKGVADSAMETLQRPDMYFRLRPTDKDFVIQGVTPDIQLLGELAIDRGRITVMENEFEIHSERRAPRVRFAGKRAEVWASAVARLRYNRDNPLTKRPQAKAVNVILDVSPLDEEDLEKSGLAHAFLNYKLDFSSEPEIIPGNAALQREAILNLVVLGDPMVDLDASAQAGAVPGESKQSAESLGETQVNRLFSGEIRKQIASLSRRGFKFLGTNLIDVFRVVPRFKYQSASSGQSQSNKGSTSAADANKQARENQLIFSDLTLELGKSLGEQLYASFQWIRFGEQSASQQSTSAGQVQRITRDQGVRAGLEYQISPNRTLEGYWNYSVDENLEPVPFDPDHIDQAHSGVVRLRNTIPTGNYTRALANERRWDAATTGEP